MVLTFGSRGRDSAPLNSLWLFYDFLEGTGS